MRKPTPCNRKKTLFLAGFLSISIFVIAQTQNGEDIDRESANDFSGYSVSMPDANTIAIGASFCINRVDLEDEKAITNGSYMSLMFFKVINKQVYEMTVSVNCTLNDQTNRLDMAMTVGDDGKEEWTKTEFGIGSTVNDMSRSLLAKLTIQYLKNKELQILKDTPTK